MARRIQKHSTRLSEAQGHTAALDAEFQVGQRVRTIDGLPGRVLFAAASFAPGLTEYEVVLDNGMGQGTYTASQLRPLPADYRVSQPIPPGLLPAGVTAAYITEEQARERWRQSPDAQAGMSAEESLRRHIREQERFFEHRASEVHLASDDYPEMGSILHERPDPGLEIRVIGRRTAADTYGRPEDPRDEDYNGGEGDVGMYWAAPAQQGWMHENIGPQEEAPPPVPLAPPGGAPGAPDDLPAPLARLAQIEEACQLIGAGHSDHLTRRATTINGQQIDEHGDAPDHGAEPRAADPEDYDERSTEGDGDPRWSGQDDPQREEKNGAAVGMYPEGMSAGGGPGLEIGPFVAGLHLVQPGDDPVMHDPMLSVPPGLAEHFRNVHGVGDDRARAEMLGANLHGYGYHELLHMAGDGYGADWRSGGVPHHLDDLRTQAGRVPWTGAERGELHRWDNQASANRGDFVPSGNFTNRAPLLDEGESPEMEAEERHVREAGLRTAAMSEDDWARHMVEKHGWTQDRVRNIAQRGMRISDMHDALTETGMTDGHSHDTRYDLLPARPEPPKGRGGEDRGQPGESVPMVTRDPGDWDERERRQRLSARRAAEGEHDAPSFDEPDGPADTPADSEADKNSLDYADPQASGGDGEDSDPDNWPMAGASITSGGPACTQGKDDGHRGRVFPPPSPPPAPGIPGAEGDGPPGEDGKDGGKGQKIQLEIKAHLAAFTAAAGDPAFRFEFTASWKDVLSKAKRIRKSGRVRITHASPGVVIGQVGGDHDTYESGIQRPPGHPQTIQHWACGCPWASFHQDKSLGTRYAGRPCSHVMALQLEALSRYGRSRDGEVRADPGRQELGLPPAQVVVKSMPPWGPGGWSQTWIAPAASLRAMATYAPMPADGDAGSHMIAHHGISEMTVRGADPAKVARFHREEHAMFPGRQTHQHDHPEGQPGESRWPDLFREREPYLIDPNGGARVERSGYEPDRTLEKFYPLPYRESARQGLSCYYRHAGACAGLDRTAESLYHDRPDGFESEIVPNPQHNPGGYLPRQKASHVLNGYVGPHKLGQLHFSVSDDGRAHRVEMLHTFEHGQGRGVGSAMMDDLSRHVKAQGGWLNHGARTEEGHDWWAGYQEPHPETNVHHVHPGFGWTKYWDPADVAAESEQNLRESGGRGRHTPITWNRFEYPGGARDEQWTRARGLEAPGHAATAALIRAGEDLDDVISLARLAGLSFTADQANAPWGSQNVTKSPPGKPYGATEKPNKDQDPGSYGFLSGPDPDNWGTIQEDSPYQMPLTNAASRREAEHKVLVPGAPSPLPASLNYPRIADWHEDQGSFTYTDQSPTAGPATSMNPGDPNGLSVDAAAGLPAWLKNNREAEGNCTRCGEPGQTISAGTGELMCWSCHEKQVAKHQREAAGTPFPINGTVPQLDGALAELHDEPEPALPSTTGDDLEATAAADGTIGGGDAGVGTADNDPEGTASLGEFGAAIEPSPVGQEPGMGSADEYLTPEDQSIQTIGQQQWSGGGADSDEGAVEPGEPQGDIDSIVAAFQRSAGAKQFAGGGPAADGDIAAAAQAFLSKTADVLPEREAAELINEGRGERARNLGLLRLEGTHYEDQDEDLQRRGLSLDDFDDDVISV
jgi:hypothetical protein